MAGTLSSDGVAHPIDRSLWLIENSDQFLPYWFLIVDFAQFFLKVVDVFVITGMTTPCEFEELEYFQPFILW